MYLSLKDHQREYFIKLLILCLFAYLLYLIHIPYELVSDDEVVANTISSQTLWGNFLDRWHYNGRIFTDVLANLFYRMPLSVWKVFDIFVYVAIASLISKIFTPNAWSDLLTVCAMVLLFPMNYLDSAGYIASSTNYVYPVACLLCVLYLLCRIRKRERIVWLQYPLTVLCILYLTNHDQSAMVLLGGLLLYLLYCIATKAEKAILKSTIFWFALSALCYLFMFLIPGHLYRMTDTTEMEYWFPQYADWSFFKKIYHGFSTTAANFLFSEEKLFFLFALLVFLLSLSQNARYKKGIALIPLAVMLVSHYTGTEEWIVFFPYSCGMPDLLPLSESIVPFLTAGIAVGSLFYTVWGCMKNQSRKYLTLLLLILAAGSREMMGFSATLYASSFRTFTFFLYALLACCLLILQECKSQERYDLWYLGLGAVAALWIR